MKRESASALLAIALFACSKSAPPPPGSSTPGPTASPATPAPDASLAAPRRFDVTFTSGPLHLRGWVVRPPDAPRLPAIVYNHGSAKSVEWETYGDLATYLVSHGYVVFLPFRRGAGGSEGEHVDDALARAPEEEHARLLVAHLVEENDDVSAAVAWIGAQPYVDATRIAVAGCSFGGIEALLSAARAPGIRAALDFAGGAATWEVSPPLRETMTAAATSARVPVMFVQAANDFSTAPSEVLSAAMRAAGKDAEARIYPPRGEGPLAGHAFCTRGLMAWGPDVFAFLDRHLSP